MTHLNKKESWTFKHAELYCEVVHWGIERENGFNAMNDGQGIWNYYVMIPESLTSKFNELWLPDKKTKFFESSPERITHDYMETPFANVDWHGGITFYDKLGQVEGHRMVKLGCDYSHYVDSERGYNYTLEEVVEECKQTAEQLAKLYLTNATNTITSNV